MVQSKKFSLKSYYLCITNIEIVQNSKSKPKNSHSCVPLNHLPNLRTLCLNFNKSYLIDSMSLTSAILLVRGYFLRLGFFADFLYLLLFLEFSWIISLHTSQISQGGYLIKWSGARSARFYVLMSLKISVRAAHGCVARPKPTSTKYNCSISIS